MSNNVPTMTVSQLKKVYEYEMADKDFWMIYPDRNNSRILQDVLDAHFNVKKQPKQYMTVEVPHQSVIKLQVECLLCKIRLCSRDPLKSHHEGKQHIKNRNMSQEASDPNEKIENLIFRDFNGIENFEEGSLEYLIQNTKSEEIIVGLEFLYGELENDVKYFTCTLCDSKIKYVKANDLSAVRMLKHLLSDEHIIEYFNIRTPNKRKDIWEARSYARQVQEDEGKVLAAIFIRKDENVALGPASFNSLTIKKQRPETPPPPPPSVETVGTTIGEVPESMDTLIHRITRLPLDEHYLELNVLIKESPESQNMLTSFLKILNQKVGLYTDERSAPAFGDAVQKLAKHLKSLDVITKPQ